MNAAPNRVGNTIANRYQLTNELGSGATATIYRALDTESGDQVAIRVLNNDKGRISYAGRYERELVITSKINHPSCIRKFDFGIEDQVPYQVMELVPGQSLAKVLDQEESLPAARALGIFRQLLCGLGACDDAGVIHRDVKPENVIVSESDEVKLIDFGIAKLVGEAALGHEKLTSIGIILGTPHYIAPEWVTRDDVDARADLYSATILLFEMLTSAPPFLSEDQRELMKMHLRDEPPRLSDRAPKGVFSEELEAMVRKGLAKDPAERFANAAEYIAAVDSLIGGPVPPAPALGYDAGVGEATEIVTHHMVPGKRRFSPLMLVGAGLFVLALVALAMLEGGSETQSAKAPGVRGSGDKTVTTEVTADTPPKDVDAKADVVPDKVPTQSPITSEQLAPVLALFEEQGLSVTKFNKEFEDSLANGACRFGRVESQRVMLCAAAGDPVANPKIVQRTPPGESKRRKWRARIERAGLHLRVEAGKKKKKKKTRRKIENAFRELS